MPIFLRKFTYNKIKEFYTKEKEEQEEKKSTQLFQPGIDPTYTTKTSKK